MSDKNNSAAHQTIFISGASSDIGIELIGALDKPELTIFAHCHQSSAKLENLAGVLKAKLIILKADLADEDATLDLLSQVESHGLKVNRFVHLAALRPMHKRFRDTDWATYRLELDVELRSAVILLNRWLPEMGKNRDGKIVFMLSSYTLSSPPMALSHYVTAKFALLGLMHALVSEYAVKQININAVSPSMIQTAFLQHIPEKMIEMTAAAHPMGRIGKPNDVVPVIKFLLSDEARFINGANIPIG